MDINDLTNFAPPPRHDEDEDDEAPEEVSRIKLRVTDVSGIKASGIPDVPPSPVSPDVPQKPIKVTPTGVTASALVVGYLSYSQIESFANCPRAYHARYFKKLKPKKHPAARLGTSVHKALENIYRWALTNRYSGKFPLEQAFETLSEVWRDPKEGLQGEAYSWWNDAATMLRNYAKHSPTIEWQNVLGIEMGQDDEEDTVETIEAPPDLFTPADSQKAREQMVDGKRRKTIMIGGVPMVTQIDKVERVNETTVRISDYKSDRQLRYQSEVDRDLQLSLYEIAIRRRFPWAEKVELELVMLRHGIATPSKERTPEDLADAEAYVQEAAHAITAEREWKPKLNRFCHFCPYKTDCDAYQEALAGGPGEEAVLARDVVQIGSDFPEIGRLRDELEHRQKILDKRKRELDAALMTHLETIPINDGLKTDDREYFLGTVARKDYPRLETVDAIAKATGAPPAVVDAKICTNAVKDEVDKVITKLKDGKPLAKAFGFSSFAGADKTLNSAQVKMLRTELDTIVKLTSSTIVMSRSRKSPAGRSSPVRELPPGAVEEAAARSRTVGAIQAPRVQAELPSPPPRPALPVSIPPAVSPAQAERDRAVVAERIEPVRAATARVITPPAPELAFPDGPPIEPMSIVGIGIPESTAKIETPTDVLTAWGWARALREGPPPTPADEEWSRENEDHIDPALLMNVWRHAAETTPPEAHTEKGVIRRPEAPDPFVPAPGAEPAPAPSDPTEAKPKRARKPMSEETRAKMSAAAKERWEKQRGNRGKAEEPVE